jgi:hypothetical protein
VGCFGNGPFVPFTILNGCSTNRTTQIKKWQLNIAHKDSLMKGQGFWRGAAGLDQAAAVPTIGSQIPDIKVDSFTSCQK